MLKFDPVPIIVAIACFFVLFQIGQRANQLQVTKLNRLLYEEGNFEAFMNTLNGTMTKILLPRVDRQVLEMDARLFSGNMEGLEDIFGSLNNSKLTQLQKVYLYRDEISYYVQKKDEQKANSVLGTFREEFKNSSNTLVKGFLREADYQVNVDLKENVGMLDEMKKQYEKATVAASKGIFAYRVAKLLKKNKDKSGITYYKEALKVLENTYYADEIKESIKELENY